MTEENKKEMFVMDVETGGFSASTNGLCSVALKVYGKDIKENIYIKPNPDLIYSSGAEKIHGLTKEWLEENGVSEEEAVIKIVKFFKDNFEGKPTSLTQNGSFDIKFLNALFERKNNIGTFSDLCGEKEDTMFITRRLKSDYNLECPNAKLGTAYTFFTGKEPKDAHDAMGDVLMTEELYDHQVKFMESKENE